MSRQRDFREPCSTRLTLIGPTMPHTRWYTNQATQWQVFAHKSLLCGPMRQLPPCEAYRCRGVIIFRGGCWRLPVTCNSSFMNSFGTRTSHAIEWIAEPDNQRSTAPSTPLAQPAHLRPMSAVNCSARSDRVGKRGALQRLRDHGLALEWLAGPEPPLGSQHATRSTTIPPTHRQRALRAGLGINSEP